MTGIQMERPSPRHAQVLVAAVGLEDGEADFYELDPSLCEPECTNETARARGMDACLPWWSAGLESELLLTSGCGERCVRHFWILRSFPPFWKRRLLF